MSSSQLASSNHRPNMRIALEHAGRIGFEILTEPTIDRHTEPALRRATCWLGSAVAEVLPEREVGVVHTAGQSQLSRARAARTTPRARMPACVAARRKAGPS